MRWRDREGSRNIEDRRHQGNNRFSFPFPRERGGLPGTGKRINIPLRGKGGIGIVGLLVVLGLLLVMGVDPRTMIQGAGEASGSRETREAFRPENREEEQLKQFISVVLKTTEGHWHSFFRSKGQTYVEPKLVLFRGTVRSGCGKGVAQMGPFYCPRDQKAYLDMSFFKDLKERFKAPGDFAQAYVIAHEIGHHVQTILGITEQVMRAKSHVGTVAANAIQVKMELQADCFAGLWANYAQRHLRIVEAGDIQEALTAAAAIGDDRIQQRTQGHVLPDTFTHGTSNQRIAWFHRGFDTGRFDACDTFRGG